MLFGRATPSDVALSPLGEIASHEWSNIPSHHEKVSLDAFVAMPNHVHGIIVIEGRHQYSPGEPDLPYLQRSFEPPRAGSLSAIVRSYKSGVSRIAAQNGYFDFAWQARFYDRILRDMNEIAKARDYIRLNPAKWFEDKYFVNLKTEM